MRANYFFLHIKSIFKKFFRSLGYDIKKINNNPINLLYILFAIKSSGRSLCVVQVGANDGVTNDPIYVAAMSCADQIVLIEPQKDLFQKLKENYEPFTGQIYFLNKAISFAESCDLYSIASKYHNIYRSESSFNPTGVSSFSREYLLSQVKNYLGEKYLAKDDLIVNYQVSCMTLKQCFDEYVTSDLVFLQIDCEGYDWDVIKTLDDYRPAGINFEIKHLSDCQLLEIEKWMKSEGYVTFLHKGDCLALRV